MIQMLHARASQTRLLPRLRTEYRYKRYYTKRTGQHSSNGRWIRNDSDLAVTAPSD